MLEPKLGLSVDAGERCARVEEAATVRPPTATNSAYSWVANESSPALKSY